MRFFNDQPAHAVFLLQPLEITLAKLFPVFLILNLLQPARGEWRESDVVDFVGTALGTRGTVLSRAGPDLAAATKPAGALQPTGLTQQLQRRVDGQRR